MLAHRHLLGAAELNPNEIRALLDTTRAFLNHAPGSIPPLLSGLTVVNLFFEDSTRTRMSFEVAIRRLGGSVLNFTAGNSSVKKGETLLDTAKNLVAMHAHCLVVRHSSSGSPAILAASIPNVAIVNAGDGFHEHPTQALLDAYTIEEKLGTVSGKRVLIIGDIAHSRVARSNIHLLKKLGAKVSVCGPPTLLPPNPEILGVEWGYRPEAFLPQADVVMTLRIQAERHNTLQLPSLAEYARFWGLNSERAKLLKKNAIILDPGPINRGVQIDPEVADGPTSVILNQVANGIGVRMAVLAAVCNPKGLSDWMESQP